MTGAETTVRGAAIEVGDVVLVAGRRVVVVAVRRALHRPDVTRVLTDAAGREHVVGDAQQVSAGVTPLGLVEDLELERLAVVELELRADELWRAGARRYALELRAEAAGAREHVAALERALLES